MNGDCHSTVASRLVPVPCDINDSSVSAEGEAAPSPQSVSSPQTTTTIKGRLGRGSRRPPQSSTTHGFGSVEDEDPFGDRRTPTVGDCPPEAFREEASMQPAAMRPSAPTPSEHTHAASLVIAAPPPQQQPQAEKVIAPKEDPRPSIVDENAARKVRKTQRQQTVHPVIAAAVSQAAVLMLFVPHTVVSHRLLEYLGPRFVPKIGIDVNPLGPVRASQLIGDLSVNTTQLSGFVTPTARISGTMSVSSVYHEDLRKIRTLCASYLTSLRLDVEGAMFSNTTCSSVPGDCDGGDVVGTEATARAFGQMRHLRTLHITTTCDASGEHLDALVLCVAAVLPRLKTLTFVMRHTLPEPALFALAVPNSLESLTIGRTEDTAAPELLKPSFGLWRCFSSLASLTLLRFHIGPEFLAGAAAGLTSLKRLDLSTCLLLDNALASLAAFPEGLEELVTGSPGCPGILAAYPHLTRIDSTKATATTFIDDLLIDRCNSIEAFQLRAQNRIDVRAGAVQAAMGHLAALPAVRSECDVPMVADMTTGNTQLPGLGVVKSLAVLEISSECLDGLGDRYPSLRSFQCQMKNDHFPVAMSSWCRLGHLHTLEFTAAPRFKVPNWTSVVGCLGVIDSTLRSLTVPRGDVMFHIAVATHLPHLSTLHVRECSLTAVTFTPVIRLAVLVSSGALSAELEVDEMGCVSVSIETAKKVLGPAALAPDVPGRSELAADRKRSSLPPPGRRRFMAAPAAPAQPAVQLERPAVQADVMEFAGAVVDKLRAGDSLSMLLDRPRRLHSFVTDGKLDVKTAPGLSLLFPKLTAITCEDLHPWSSPEECLRPYWPTLSLNKAAPAE